VRELTPAAMPGFSDHPFLRKPDRRRAYEDLLFKPSGTYRSWAERWDWTLPRVHRFLASLEREGLANVRRTRFGTIVELLIADRNKTVTQPELASSTATVTQAERDRDATVREPEPLGSTTGSKSLGLGTRLDERVDNYTAACIETMNTQLSRIFGANYRHVLYDNRRSGEASSKWQAAGVELEFAVDEIRKACLKFHPEKHGHGRLPGTLGYFERGVLDAHAARHQAGLSLPPVVQRGGAPRDAQREPAEPVPLGTTVMDVFRKTAAAGGRRL
jgi:hypothetical protein